uniref:BY PROTMAP: gi/342320527/gb/EGU12467.1/ Proteophosphoglycan ppg4 [Rhodotorula glutinis ATCC 204091] n=1 Tax=Rhodotorula toruloides TaxID=5286 RepID=A0A0K3CH92_RHOTO
MLARPTRAKVASSPALASLPPSLHSLPLALDSQLSNYSLTMPGRRYEPEDAAPTTSRRLCLRNATSRSNKARLPRQSTPSISKTLSVASEGGARSKEGRDSRKSLTNVNSRSSCSSSGSSASVLVHFASRTKRILTKLVKPNATQGRSQDIHSFHFAFFETPPLDELEKKERESPFARFGIGSRRDSSSSDTTAVDSSELRAPTFRVQCSLDIPALPDFLSKALADDEDNESLVWAESDDPLASIFSPALERPHAPRIPCIDLPPCDASLPDPSTLDLPHALADRLAASLSPTHPREPSQSYDATSRFSDWTPSAASVCSISAVLPSFAFETPTRPPSPYKSARTLFPPRPPTLGRIDSGEEGWKTDKRDEEEARKAREALKEAFTDLAKVRLMLATSGPEQSTGRTSEAGGWNEVGRETDTLARDGSWEKDGAVEEDSGSVRRRDGESQAASSHEKAVKPGRAKSALLVLVPPRRLSSLSSSSEPSQRRKINVLPMH